MFAIFGALSCFEFHARAEEFERIKGVIYGRKHGVALTIDVITPAEQKNRAVIFVVSGGALSSRDKIDKAIERGSIQGILDRFIRHHSKRYNIIPNKIGMTGASAGGNLTLLQPADRHDCDPNANAPVDLESSKE